MILYFTDREHRVRYKLLHLSFYFTLSTMNNPLKLLKLSMHFSVNRIKDPNDSPEVAKTTVAGL